MNTKMNTKTFNIMSHCAVLYSVTQLCPTVCDPMDCSPPGSSVHRDSPGQNTGIGCHALIQGIFPTQGLKPGLPHCRQILYHLSHQGSPRILQCIVYPFSRGTSQPRNWTRVSCVLGRFFTSWATQKAPWIIKEKQSGAGELRLHTFKTGNIQNTDRTNQVLVRNTGELECSQGVARNANGYSHSF